MRVGAIAAMITGILRLVTSFTAAPSRRTSVPPASPPILYGTAWKKERTRDLVLQALRLGFRGIDTACQPKHYNEAGVGAAIEESGITRCDIHLQTKFTPISGQDPARVPYDVNATLDEQVRQSVAASLRNLRTPYIDCLLLHSPLATHQQTMQVWCAMEEFVASGEVKALGISNIYDLGALKRVHDDASVKPKIVQNRFYAETRHDSSLRTWCDAHGVRYQSFWTITGNKAVVQGRAVRAVASAHSCTPEQAWLGFVTALGIQPLSGTTSEEHMSEDLDLPVLSDAEIERLGHLIG